jgi:hypothetical protein
MKQSIVKALPERLRISLPERLRISIGGHFGPCYEAALKKGHLIYTYWPARESCSREPEPRRDEIRPLAKQWQTFMTRSIGSTSGAGRPITLILPSATGPVGSLKSFTRIDRYSRVAITAFRGGTDERFPLASMRGTIPSRNSVALSPN